MEDSFWQWVESLQRSLGLEDRTMVRRLSARQYDVCIHRVEADGTHNKDCIVCHGSGLAAKCENCGETLRYSFPATDPVMRHLDTGKEECYQMPFQAHLNGDNGAHHILPGWGKHPDDSSEFVTPDVRSEEHEQGMRPKARIGPLTHGDGSAWFDPDLPSDHLPNAHLMITGESGSGKTQAMKTLLADLGLPALVLDFKDDYAEKNYAAKEGFAVYDPTQRPLPFNPLQPPVDPQTGKANKTFHTYQLSEILGRIYHLGELQQHNLREAIMACYVDAGEAIPTFDQVKDKLNAGKGNGELLGHLAPIFDFGFFADPDPTGFAQIASGNTVIRLAQLPGNEVKNSVAEFFLMALYNYLVRLEQTHLLRQVLVLDEAWRVVNSPFLEPLMREARAFGLGVFVATQFPTDLPLAVSGSAATALYFSQSNPDQITEIARDILGQTSGSEAMRLGTTVRAMLPLQVIVHNKQYEPYVIADARPYYARGHEVDARVAVEVETIYQELAGLEPKSAMPRIRPDRLPANLKNTIETFRDNPNVHVLDDPYCAAGRCGDAAWAFREHARQRGHVAEAIDVTSPAYREGGGQHVVVKVDGKHYVDWTARQFHPKSEVPRVYNALTGDVDSTGFSEEQPADERALTDSADDADVDFTDHPYTFPEEDEHDNAGLWDSHDVPWRGNGPAIERQFNWWHNPGGKTGRVVVAKTAGRIDCHECRGSGINTTEGEVDRKTKKVIPHPCHYCEGSGKVERGGRQHLIEPDEDSINYIDFESDPEDDDPMPYNGPQRVAWHNGIMDMFHEDHGIKTDDLKVDPKWEACPCEGKDRHCEHCGGSGIYTTNWDPDYGELAKRLNAKGFDTYDSDTRFEVYNGKAHCDEEDCHDDPKARESKVAQEVAPHDLGPFVCTRCGTGTTSTDGTCADCKRFVKTFAPSDESLQQRVDNAVGGTAFTSAYVRKTKDCISCGRRVHENDSPLDTSNAEMIAEEHDMKGPDQAICFLCANDYNSYQYGLNKAMKRWEPVPGTTPCKDCKSTGLRPVNGTYKPCLRCKGSGFAFRSFEAKTVEAEMQKFPPGEDDDENSTWAPFSMSEWQMVKGPKKRSGAVAAFHQFDDDEDDAKGYDTCVDCDGDGRDHGQYDDICHTHGGAKREGGDCAVQQIVHEPRPCDYTSTKGETCGNCRGTGLMPNTDTCVCGHTPEAHGMTRGGCMSCMASGRPTGEEERACKTCQAEGQIPDGTTSACEHCKGSGNHDCSGCINHGKSLNGDNGNCEWCGGSGRQENLKVCPRCNGEEVDPDYEHEDDPDDNHKYLCQAYRGGEDPASRITV